MITTSNTSTVRPYELFDILREHVTMVCEAAGRKPVKFTKKERERFKKADYLVIKIDIVVEEQVIRLDFETAPHGIESLIMTRVDVSNPDTGQCVCNEFFITAGWHPAYGPKILQAAYSLLNEEHLSKAEINHWNAETVTAFQECLESRVPPSRFDGKLVMNVFTEFMYDDEGRPDLFANASFSFILPDGRELELEGLTARGDTLNLHEIEGIVDDINEPGVLDQMIEMAMARELVAA